jgi:hypothetical protein
VSAALKPGIEGGRMDSFFALIQDFLTSPHFLFAAAGGAVAAVVDRKVFGRWLLAALLVLALIAGEIAMRVNPFPYLGGDYYLQGLIVSTGAIAALVGYAIAAFAMLLLERSK